MLFLAIPGREFFDPHQFQRASDSPSVQQIDFKQGLKDL